MLIPVHHLESLCLLGHLYHHEGLYRYVLALVKDLGCRKYSIGSDGHKLEHFRLNFDKIQELLREFEITEDMII